MQMCSREHESLEKTRQLSTPITDLGIVGDFTFFFIVFQMVWLFLGVQISPLQSYKNVEFKKGGKEVESWTSMSSRWAWVWFCRCNVGAGWWRYPDCGPSLVPGNTNPTHTGRSCRGCPPLYRPGVFMSLMPHEVKFSSCWPLHFPKISWNLL